MRHHHTFMVNTSYNWVQSDVISSNCPPTLDFFLLFVGRDAAMMMRHGHWELWLAACNLPSRQSLLHMYSANFLRDCFSPWLAYLLCWSGHFNHLVAVCSPLCFNCLPINKKWVHLPRIWVKNLLRELWLLLQMYAHFVKSYQLFQ